VLDQARLAARYLRDLPRFLRDPHSPEECRRRIRRQLESREQTFLQLVERAIFSNPRSPYAPLLRQLGIEFGDIAALVRDEGADGAASALYEAGARLSVEEFKCLRPIVRPGLELHPQDSDFDNPLIGGHLPALSGGSGGSRRRIMIDFESLTHSSCYLQMVLASLRAEDHPAALWYPLPMGGAGISQLLGRQKLGKGLKRWFTQTKLRPRTRDLGPAFFTASTVAACRLWGSRVALPRQTPPERAEIPARWLADQIQEGSPALFNCTPSSAVRICRAAEEHGLDISGSVFRLGGEPYTAGKARVVEAAGCRAASNYYGSEFGQAGISCGEPAALDDVHLTSDSLALVQSRQESAAGQVGALYFTSLRLTARKVLLNVESGDYATLEQRTCGCPVEEVGFRRHFHTIRSYEKLATEGMTFVGSELHALVEEVLPGRFGGYPTDYQFVEEEEEEGLTRLGVVVNPRLGQIEDAQIVETVLAHLAERGNAQEEMSEIWRLGDTLQVLRREPHVTEASKTLPLKPLSRR
jgi:hypothetical protein